MTFGTLRPGRTLSSDEASRFLPAWRRWAGITVHLELADRRIVLCMLGDYIKIIPGKTKTNGALHVIDHWPSQPR